LAAAALAQELGAEAARVSVESAGTAARDGDPASAQSIEIAARDGLDLRPHRSRRVTRDMLQEADLVLVMEPSHRAAVERLGGNPHRVAVLSEWPAPGEPGLGVSDPFGASIEAYEECWRRIRLHVRRVAPQVREAVRTRSL
jgi:protein-tyrosine phosphatase